MFDPMTIAHEIKYPWKRKSEFFPDAYRDCFITIWHKDPCTDGSDDSCDWFGHKKDLGAEGKKLQEAAWNLETILDNRPFFPDHPAHLRFQEVKNAIWDMKKVKGFRIHPRWHFWHWRIQIHPLQATWQWLTYRCCFCKKGFKYNESKMGNWDGDKVWHHGCNQNTEIKK
jgi:hypothetical protein